MDRYQTSEALVLNKRTLKESDVLITLLTPRLGKIVALAKGAKNIKSSRLGSLQLGNRIKVHLYKKNDFTWISETKNISPFLQLNKSLTQASLLFYFLEIINHFIAENQQIEGVYQISCNIVNSINNNQFNVFIKNEMNLLEILGFGVPLEIEKYYFEKDYKAAQKYLKNYFESIIEKPLESNKLFK